MLGLRCCLGSALAAGGVRGLSCCGAGAPGPGASSRCGSLLWSAGFVLGGVRLSCSEARGILPGQGSSLCLQRWQVGSSPLSRQGSPGAEFLRVTGVRPVTSREGGPVWATRRGPRARKAGASASAQAGPPLQPPTDPLGHTHTLTCTLCFPLNEPLRFGDPSLLWLISLTPEDLCPPPAPLSRLPAALSPPCSLLDHQREGDAVNQD